MIDVILGDELVHRGEIASVDLFVEAPHEGFVLGGHTAPELAGLRSSLRLWKFSIEREPNAQPPAVYAACLFC
jgi:hypothetical protein